jgi:hypothetical protein
LNESCGGENESRISGLDHGRRTPLSDAPRTTVRQAWRVRLYRFGTEPVDDLVTSTTADERLEMMWPLACEAWSLTGRPMPDYSRAETPVSLRRLGT